ncbi:hypothetical protein [Roseimaritima ulvae]|uniref:Uncharacterized protein n=1 Tax=Roseimaritima ulvae TaxID=980254 RepID=A0A5B9QTP8_9BACT|nr:hypothetical protein [Roseimaritima ulvae]QEG42427.1 hypothetical protein UC8_44660 [Roseimaritima ulvae]
MTNSDKPDSDTESVQSRGTAMSASTPAMRTGWWVLFALGLLAIGVIGAVLGVKMRRTQTAQTSLFFGPQTISALQSSTSLRLHLDDGESSASAASQPVDLSDIPGVGHLRHALLDERHYDWTTQQGEDIDSLVIAASQPDGSAGEWCTIELEGTPPGHAPIEPTQIRVELTEGWVGIPGGNGRVRLRERVAKALRSQVKMISNVDTARADAP